VPILNGQDEGGMSRTNYIFIDFENVQETELERIANKPVKVTVVLGKAHTKLPIGLVKTIQQFSQQIQLVETALNGKNALDFVLANEIGVASAIDPSGYFHVISRDKGFDALVHHLKSRSLLAARHAVLSDIPVLMNVSERVKHLRSHFTASPTNPKQLKTLESHIHAVFGKLLTPGEVAETVGALIAAKVISLSDKGAVAYAA
jgi:hypothetical protein